MLEVAIPLWVRRHISPPPPPPSFPSVQAAVMSLEGDPVRVAVRTATLTGSRVLALADAWSGMTVCRWVLCAINGFVYQSPTITPYVYHTSITFHRSPSNHVKGARHLLAIIVSQCFSICSARVDKFPATDIFSNQTSRLILAGNTRVLAAVTCRGLGGGGARYPVPTPLNSWAPGPVNRKCHASKWQWYGFWKARTDVGVQARHASSRETVAGVHATIIIMNTLNLDSVHDATSTGL